MNAQDSAYPLQLLSPNPANRTEGSKTGLTKRELVSIECLKGMLSAWGNQEFFSLSPEKWADAAVQQADALIERLSMSHTLGGKK